MSSKRIKEVFESIDSNVQEIDGWTVTTDSTMNNADNEKMNEKVKLDNINIQTEKKVEINDCDLDDFDENQVQDKPEKKEEMDEFDDFYKMDDNDLEMNNKIRHYDISITYDLYYNTPRLWLSGNKADGTPLSDEEIFEDIMSDYVNKTVTFETHPVIGTKQASIHPCKHASVMHYLVNQANTNEQKITHKHAMFIFLKFMNSVLPTLEFDYTTEIPAG